MGSPMTAATRPGPASRIARLDLGGGGGAAVRMGVGPWAAVAVGRPDVRRLEQHRLVHLPPELRAADGERPERRPVIVRPARDEHRAVGLAAEHVVVAGHLERDLDGLRATRREDHVVEVAGRQARDPLGEGDRGLGREDVADGVRQARGLVGDRVDHLLPAVPDVGDRDPGDRIQVLASVAVPDADAVGTLEHRVGPRRVEREQGAGVGAGVRRHHIPSSIIHCPMMTRVSVASRAATSEAGARECA